MEKHQTKAEQLLRPAVCWFAASQNPLIQQPVRECCYHKATDMVKVQAVKKSKRYYI
jgi:hypothetical protein